MKKVTGDKPVSPTEKYVRAAKTAKKTNMVSKSKKG